MNSREIALGAALASLVGIGPGAARVAYAQGEMPGDTTPGMQPSPGEPPGSQIPPHGDDMPSPDSTWPAAPPVGLPAPDTMDPTPVVTAPARDARPPSRIGVTAALGAGVTDFADEQVRAFTQPGASWEARAAAGTRLPVAIEGAYLGSAQEIDALGLDNEAVLLGQGVEGALRLNLTTAAVQPYLFGGIGWTHYRLANADTNTSSLQRTDDILSVPFGVGVSIRFARQFLFDVRGTGRAAFYDEMMEAPYANTGQDANLHSWNAVTRLGWEF